MISDVCSAILANPHIKSNFCLVYRDSEEANLETYQYDHRREIGINYDPQGIEKKNKHLYAVHFWIACILIVIINLCAWTIARHKTKKETQKKTREMVNMKIQNYLELNTTERANLTAIA